MCWDEIGLPVGKSFLFHRLNFEGIFFFFYHLFLQTMMEHFEYLQEQLDTYKGM